MAIILEFFRFELREQLRSPLPWLLAALFATLAFVATASDAVQVGGGIGNVHRNAPVVLAQLLTVFTLLGMLISALFVNSALLRDFDQGTAELVFASPIRRRDFLIGRLAAAMVASLGVYLLIALAMFVAQFMPWIEPARLGPVRMAPYLWTFAVIVVPNVLFTGALLALLATLTRSILWVYIGILGFFVLYIVSAVLMRDLDNVWAAVLAEPLGVRAMSRTVRYWSAEERNTRLPEFAGYLLANRALWSAIALGLLAAACSGGAARRPRPSPTPRRRACARPWRGSCRNSAPPPRGGSSCARCASTPSACCAACPSWCCSRSAWSTSCPPR